MTRLKSCLLTVLLVLIHGCEGKLIDFESDVGAIPDDKSSQTAWKNGGLLNVTLNALHPGDVFRIPNKTFHVMGGIEARDFKSITISIDGILNFLDDTKHWPRAPSDGVVRVKACIAFYNVEDITITSSSKGTLEGNGETWWGIPGVGYLIRGEDRPRLLEIHDSRNVLVENLYLHNSPYWTFYAPGIDGLEVRHVDIRAARSGTHTHHGVLDLTAFNTDGFDVSGKNVWIHDCSVWNQDDCIAVKDGSANMLFERITASGMGLTIGSIGDDYVRNITFRDIYMPNTVKGIYMKFREVAEGPGSVQDIVVENVVMEKPEQYAFWIGPAQQSDTSNLCAAHPCSICWPHVPFTSCNMPEGSQYSNILLRNITVNDPKGSIGMIMGSKTKPITNLEFRDVVVNNPKKGGGGYAACENVEGGIATGTTNHIPPCFIKS